MTTKTKGKMPGMQFVEDVKAGRVSKAAVKQKGKDILGHIFRYILLISLGFVIVTPLLNLLKEAVTAHSVLGMKSSEWVPPEVSSVSFQVALEVLDYWKGLVFSLLNTAILAILQTLCAALAAYSFARMKFKGSGILWAIVIFSIVVPSQSIMLAQYITFRNFDILGIFKLLTGNPISLIGSDISLYLLAGTGMGVKGGLFIYILRQNFRQLPISIEEAAFVDGAGFLKTFFSIVLPSSATSLTTVGVLSFLWNYADVYFTSLLTSSSKSLALTFNRLQSNIRWPIGDAIKVLPKEVGAIVNKESPLVQSAVAAGCALLVVIPLLILYLFVQKRFVQGVERSGLGGD